MDSLEQDDKKFDLMVTHRDDRTGLITHTTPYILRITGEVGSNERSKMWERPSGSGNLFDRQNNPIGRWVYEEKVIKGKKVRVGSHAPDAEHIAYSAPLTADQKLRQELSAKSVEIAELKRELDSINAEKVKKSAPAQTKKEQGA